MNTEPQPLSNIIGELVSLGPLQRDLIPLYQKWDNDFIVNRTTTGPRPVTLEEEMEAYDRFAKDRSYVFFTIYERATGRPIGKTYLMNVRNRTAEYAIVIGERSCHGKGYGTETTRLVLDYAFTVPGLRNVMLTVVEFNRAGIRAYEKAGFRTMGRRRQCVWLDGRLWDILYMDCVADEFTSPVLGKMLGPEESSSSTGGTDKGK